MSQKLGIKKNRHLDTQGFTLVEMLLYMGLLAIFLGILSQLFVSILELHSESQATSAVELDGRFILARLMYDINRASSVVTPASLGGVSDVLEILIDGVSYSYRLNGDDLQLVNDIGVNNLNSSESKISGLSFQRLGNLGGKDTIKIQFTLDSVTQRPSGSETRTFETTVGTR